MRKKKGFTLIELLVVIAIIAMLLAILMPALGKVKKLAMRLVCGTNVKGLGTAMNVYAFDYDDEFPVQGQGGPRTWGEKTNSWAELDGGPDWDAESKITIEASLYMLVREADVSPKSFICPATSDKEFKISEDPVIGDDAAKYELTDLYDFGAYPCGGWDGDGDGNSNNTEVHVSYSYQQVYDDVNTDNEKMNRPDASGNAANVVLADRSPWADCDLEVTSPEKDGVPEDWESYVTKLSVNYENSSSDETVKIANSANHDREGQNVLYNDGHAEFAKRSDVSYNNDNIYTRNSNASDEIKWRSGDRPYPMNDGGYATTSKDTILVSSQSCD